jgi:hypothetical protein
MYKLYFNKNIDRHIAEKDKIYGDLIATRKKRESGEAELARIELSYERLVKEKETLESNQQQQNEEIKKYKDAVSCYSLIFYICYFFS